MRLVLSLSEPQGHVMNSAPERQVLVVEVTALQPCNGWDVGQELLTDYVRTDDLSGEIL